MKNKKLKRILLDMNVALNGLIEQNGTVINALREINQNTLREIDNELMTVRNLITSSGPVNNNGKLSAIQRAIDGLQKQVRAGFQHNDEALGRIQFFTRELKKDTPALTKEDMEKVNEWVGRHVFHVEQDTEKSEETEK